MTLQWYHNNGNKDAFRDEIEFTACIDVPDIQAFHHLAQLYTPNTININVGVAKLHPKDRYCKKIGREESQKKLAGIEFTLLKVDYNDDYTAMTLYSLVHRIQLYFTFGKKSGSARLIAFYFNR